MAWVRISPMNHKAMSLVEVLVALVILSIAALGVASTIGLVSQGRTSTGSLDLKAASYAREVFEGLKNNVATAGSVSHPEYLDDTSNPTRNDAAPCPKAQGQLCGTSTGGVHLLSPTADGFARSYTVWDYADGKDGIAYKKVTVTVTWPG